MVDYTSANFSIRNVLEYVKSVMQWLKLRYPVFSLSEDVESTLKCGVYI